MSYSQGRNNICDRKSGNFHREIVGFMREKGGGVWIVRGGLFSGGPKYTPRIGERPLGHQQVL